jgi:hypothetical protein
VTCQLVVCECECERARVVYSSSSRRVIAAAVAAAAAAVVGCAQVWCAEYVGGGVAECASQLYMLQLGYWWLLTITDVSS